MLKSQGLFASSVPLEASEDTLPIDIRHFRFESSTEDVPAAEAANENLAPAVPLSLSGIVSAERKTGYGVIIRSTTHVWSGIVKQLGTNWSRAYESPPQKWEELVAGAFNRAGYDEVTITPRSGDHGRDVIAVKRGVGSIKIINSVKAYRPGHLVSYDDVRALLSVMSGERDTSKGIVTTTSDFPPLIARDPFIAPFLPTRLELYEWHGAKGVVDRSRQR